MRLVLPIAAIIALAGCAREAQKEPPSQNPPEKHALVTRTPDAAAGRDLFVVKGCVMCHSVNGVGGKAAPALDADTEMDPIDPVAFAARMWRGAAAMVELQNLELGYVIDMSADDIVNLAAFTADSDEQKKLKATDIPQEMRDSILDQRFWETEDWSEFLKKGQEGKGDPEQP